MLNLGGQVLGFPDAGVSSASKGETVADTIRVISCVADIAAMRHPKEGAPLRASRYSRIPVINAGDGGHSHPTQTLLDMMTIRQRKGHLDHLTIGFCGDLKFGRTVHSLIKSLCSSHPRSCACRITSSAKSSNLTTSPMLRHAAWRRLCPIWTSST